MLALGLLAWLGIVLWLWWELKHAATKPILPSPYHLPCGECFWIASEMWVSSSPFPDNLVDQLVISVYCPVHGTFAHKRWKESHLDDAGIYPDNYRGFLEGD